MARAKILDLIYRVRDQASVPLKNMGTASKGTNAALKDLGLTGGALIGVLAGLGYAGKEAFDKYQEYTLDVASFAAQINSTTEAASQLKLLMDRFAITEDTMLAAMRSLAKQGISPTIEGLESVRAQLDATANNADRLKLAQQLLGEQGIKQILPLFDELNKEQLAAYIANMSDAQIVTEEEAAKTREMRQELQKAQSAWEDLNLSIGQFIQLEFLHSLERGDELLHGQYNIMTKLPFLWTEFFREQSESDKWYQSHHGFYDYYQEGTKAIEGADEAIGNLSTRQLYAKALEASLAGNHELEQNYLDQIAAINDATSALDAYIQMAQIAASVQFSPGSSALERGLGGSGGSGGGHGWQYGLKDALGRTYDYNPDTGEYNKHYAAGGVVPGPAGQPQRAIVHGGEEIIPPGGARDEALLSELRRNRLAVEALAQNIVGSIRDAVERAR